MLNRLLFLFLALVIGTCAHTQDLAGIPHPARTPDLARPQAPLPSPEEFVNAICHTVVDSPLSNYYLLKGADTCRFVRYDYDEWSKYHLLEPVPISILNELSEKVYLSRYPYFWKTACAAHRHPHHQPPGRFSLVPESPQRRRHQPPHGLQLLPAPVH
jgi:hypothetical protein